MLVDGQFLVQGPGIKAGTVSKDIISNVDFAPTWMDFAGLAIPSFMQGESFKQSLAGEVYQSTDAVAYHRYWMHADAIHNAYVSYLFLIALLHAHLESY